jgi:hypothetical protein
VDWPVRRDPFGDTQAVKSTRRFATNVVLSGSLGLAALGLAGGIAQAQPMAPIPTYHWCPGDNWDPGWGNNWDGGNCHDDHHRDADFDNHDHDYWGDRGPDRWGPPRPPCVPFVNCPP